MPEDEQNAESGRIIVQLDPWRTSSTTDESWTVLYNIPDGDDTWEVDGSQPDE